MKKTPVKYLRVRISSFTLFDPDEEGLRRQCLKIVVVLDKCAVGCLKRDLRRGEFQFELVDRFLLQIVKVTYRYSDTGSSFSVCHLKASGRHFCKKISHWKDAQDCACQTM